MKLLEILRNLWEKITRAFKKKKTSSEDVMKEWEEIEKVYWDSIDSVLSVVEKINKMEIDFLRRKAQKNIDEVKIYLLEVKKNRHLWLNNEIDEQEFWERRRKLYDALVEKLKGKKVDIHGAS